MNFNTSEIINQTNLGETTELNADLTFPELLTTKREAIKIKVEDHTPKTALTEQPSVVRL